MELVKIMGGLAAIGVLVFVIALDRGEGEETASAAPATVRSFSAGDSSARFVVPETAAAEAAATE